MERVPKVVFFVVIGVLSIFVLIADSDVNLPGNNEGYAPVQPIPFSHRVHAGDLQIDCKYCHYGVTKSRHAGIPAASICMNCHRSVTAGMDAVLQEKAAADADGREPQRIVSGDLRLLYDALALDPDLNPDPNREPRPIEWVRVHNLPDFVYFDHRPHVTAGLACESCHGPVQSMERMRQHSDLSMGWCVQCHRESSAGPILDESMHPRFVPDHASTDCVSCHY